MATTTPAPDFSDTELSAWLDGELESERQATLDAALREQPELAARARLWAADREALRARLDPTLGEPLPPRLLHTVWHHRARAPWARAAMAAGLLVAQCLLATASRAQDELLLPCADAPALQRAVEQLNAVRQRATTPCDGIATPSFTPRHALVWEQRLAGSAQAQASDLAQRDLLSHVDAQQRSFGSRLRSAGYAAAGAGENLAAGQTDFNDTLQAWLASPTHCANLMQPDFRDVGLACVQRLGSRYERFWVAHLGAPVRRLTAAAPSEASGARFALR